MECCDILSQAIKLKAPSQGKWASQRITEGASDAPPRKRCNSAITSAGSENSPVSIVASIDFNARCVSNLSSGSGFRIQTRKGLLSIKHPLNEYSFMDAERQGKFFAQITSRHGRGGDCLSICAAAFVDDAY